MNQQQKEILLIEDDLDLADVITAFFKQKKIQVHHFSNPIEALKQVEEKKIHADIILTDFNLPELSGIQIIQQLKEKGDPTPVILITVSSDVDIAVQAIEAGAHDFVVKPLHFPQLYISVQRALRLAKLDSENIVLKREIDLTRGKNPSGMVGRSESFRKAMDIARRVAQSTATVFISGESGSGKEVFAKSIHAWSPRQDAPFIALNCSAIPENLLESELFGHAKGAFTGAIDKKMGLFEEAEGGTIFLDEIGDMSLVLQAKLLRVLQERKIKRIGENQLRPIDVRVITATHKDLRHEVQEKRFREDLFFRLNVIPIKIPPLRERKEDILLLADYFLKKFNALNGTDIKGFSIDAKEYLLKNHWKGNVRELENTIERAVVLCNKPEIDADLLTDFDNSMMQAPSEAPEFTGENVFFFKHEDQMAPLAEVEKKYIQYVYEKNRHAKESTAKILGIDRKTLYRRLQEMQI